MIPHSDIAAGMFAGQSWQIHHRLASWRNGVCLAEDIPAVEVEEGGDASLRVPERITFKVPIVDDQGNTWVPTSYSAPLGIWGQRIVSQIGVSVGSSEVEWINRGVFLLHSVDTDGDSISVECLGLLQLLDEAELATDFQPAVGATFGETIRQLIEPGISVDLDLAPEDEIIPTSAATWSDNRLDDIYMILDAWAAQIKVTAEGNLEVLPIDEPPIAEDVVFTFTDTPVGVQRRETTATGSVYGAGVYGAGAYGVTFTQGALSWTLENPDTWPTVIEWNTQLTRDGAFNAVIAQGVYDDDRGALAGQEIVHTAVDLDSNSPYSLGGDFSPYLVPHKFSNPLLNEHVPVLLAAYAKLADLRQRATNTVQITAVPHPAIALGDPVSVTSARLGIDGELGRVVAFTLPHEGGAMGVTVRLQGLI